MFVLFRTNIAFILTTFALGPSVILLATHPSLPIQEAYAADAVTTMNIIATVQKSCTIVQTDPINFSPYNSATNTTATGKLSIQCTLNTPYDISIGGGQNMLNNVRRMKTSGTDNTYLTYILSPMSSHNPIWGGIGGPTGCNALPGIGMGSIQYVPVYARIPSGQIVASGDYTDRVAVTVSF